MISGSKGNVIVDSFMFVIVIAIFVFLAYIANVVLGDINADVQDDDDISADTKQTVDEWNTRFPSLFDGAFLLVFILLWILVLVASYQVDTNPAFFVVTLIIMVVVFFVAAQMSNVYEDFASDEEIAATAANYPITDWIMSHLLIVLIAVAFSVVLVLFGKNRLG